MSTSAAKQSANQTNAQNSTGPRTEPGKAASAKNATKYGLFSAKDFIRLNEQSDYDELDQSLRTDLFPEGRLEHHLVDEIRRAMWRLRRCGDVEAAMVETCTSLAARQNEPTTIPDPMQNEPTAAIQLAVDRARAQCHRLLHKCVAELRKLQTERNFRFDYFEREADACYGLADVRAINKGLGEKASSMLQTGKVVDRKAAADHERAVWAGYRKMLAQQEIDDPIPPQNTEQTQTPRNAQCPCGSGKKYKRCCGEDAPPVLQTAA